MSFYMFLMHDLLHESSKETFIMLIVILSLHSLRHVKNLLEVCNIVSDSGE